MKLALKLAIGSGLGLTLAVVVVATWVYTAWQMLHKDYSFPID